MLRRIRASGGGARGRVSWLTIRGGRGTCEYAYTATITEETQEKAVDPRPPRKDMSRLRPNRPDIDPDTYWRRWCVEIGYLIPENGRTRTRCTTPAACTYCLVSSCLFYNAWVTAAALLAMRGRALKWMKPATALGRLLFDPTLKPGPPPEMSEVISFEALLR